MNESTSTLQESLMDPVIAGSRNTPLIKHSVPPPNVDLARFLEPGHLNQAGFESIELEEDEMERSLIRGMETGMNEIEKKKK
jgi:hypothetical protein